MSTAGTAHWAPVGDGGWGLWRDVALASAGFPASHIAVIRDDRLAAAADLRWSDTGTASARFEAAYASAKERLRVVIREIAAGQRFREAVTWQGPALLMNHVDGAAAGKLSGSGGRLRQRAVARCLQRYCLSTETLGFFGPVGWAWVGHDNTCLDVTPDSGQLSRRTIYFDPWPIEVLAAKIAARPEVAPWLAPCVVPSAVIDGQLLRLPFREPIALSESEARLLAECDGTRAVLTLTGDPPDPERLSLLSRLSELGAVRMGFDIPFSAWPERDLEDRITRIADPVARAWALAAVAELSAARDAVSAAAGDPDQLRQTTATLAGAFRRIAPGLAERGNGTERADRSLVYEDTVRDVEIRIGGRLTDMLATPLTLLLDSAAWLVNTVAANYLASFRRLISQAAGGNGIRRVPLLQVAVMAMPEAFLPSGGHEPAVVAEAVAEFQARWHRILAIPPGVRRHHVASAEIAAQAAREFATGPAAWSGARVHSADIMIAAAGVEAIARRECEFVLSKLRLATNSLESRVFVAQHPDPSRLLAAAEADYLDRRVYAIPKRNSPFVTPRLCPPSALLSPRYTYLCLGLESVAAPAQARLLPAADLMVELHGDKLAVRCGGDGSEYDLAEVVGEMLAALIAPAFRPLGTSGHQPRTNIDRLVISRESWTFSAPAATWAFIKDERKQYLLARQWRAEHGLPEQVFATAPAEDKPLAVDFRSLPLVGILATLVRATAKHGGNFTITEMLPDTDEFWLRDVEGNAYAAELKFVAVDNRAS